MNNLTDLSTYRRGTVLNFICLCYVMFSHVCHVVMYIDFLPHFLAGVTLEFSNRQINETLCQLDLNARLGNILNDICTQINDIKKNI